MTPNNTPRPLGELPVGAAFGLFADSPFDWSVLAQAGDYTLVGLRDGRQFRAATNQTVHPKPARPDRE